MTTSYDTYAEDQAAYEEINLIWAYEDRQIEADRWADERRALEIAREEANRPRPTREAIDELLGLLNGIGWPEPSR